MVLKGLLEQKDKLLKQLNELLHARCGDVRFAESCVREEEVI